MGVLAVKGKQYEASMPSLPVQGPALVHPRPPARSHALPATLLPRATRAWLRQLFNIMTAKEEARRLKGSGVEVYVAHPGLSITDHFGKARSTGPSGLDRSCSQGMHAGVR